MDISIVLAAPSTMTEELGDTVVEPCTALADDGAEVPGVVEEIEGTVLADVEAFEAGITGESGSSVDVPTEAELWDVDSLVEELGSADIVFEAVDTEEAGAVVVDPDEAALLLPNPIRDLSLSKTEYTFFRKTSPRRNCVGPSTCTPKMVLSQRFPPATELPR